MPELTGYPSAAQRLRQAEPDQSNWVLKNTVPFCGQVLILLCHAIDLRPKSKRRWYIAHSAIALQGSLKMGLLMEVSYRMLTGHA